MDFQLLLSSTVVKVMYICLFILVIVYIFTVKSLIRKTRKLHRHERPLNKSNVNKAMETVRKWVAKQLTFTKILVVFLIYKGCSWIDQSYQLAWVGKDEIAEGLSERALIELLGVAMLYAIKATITSISEYNTWPDKPCDIKDKGTEKTSKSEGGNDSI